MKLFPEISRVLNFLSKVDKYNIKKYNFVKKYEYDAAVIADGVADQAVQRFLL